MNNISSLTLLIIYFLIILLYFVLSKKQITINNPYINLIKPLLPSWKFYDDFHETTLLFYQIKLYNHDAYSDWIPIYRTPPVKLSMLISNAEGNLILAAHSHLQQLVYDIEKHNSTLPFEETVSYKITKNLVSYYLLQRNNSPFSYKFKLSSVSDSLEIEDDILISPTYEENLK